MLVTELGITTDVRPEQPKKAQLPMLFTELGISTDVRLVQYSKALSGTAVTFSPNVMVLIPVEIAPLPE